MYGSLLVGFLLQLVYTSTISRILSPRAFGVIALGLIAVRFGTHMSQLGVSSALVQRTTIDPIDIRSAFSTSWLLGFLAFGVFWVVSPLLSELLVTPSLTPVARVLGASFLLNGLGITSQGLLRRQRRFRYLAIVETVSYSLAYPVVGIVLASRGFGVWSLVVASLFQIAIQVTMWYAVVRHPLRPSFNPLSIRHLYGFGAPVSAIGFLEFTTINADTLAVGKFAGPGVLGQYGRASLLVALPIQQLARAVTQVLFPSFSRIKDDRERVAASFMSGLAIFTGTLAPACAVLVAVAKPLVRVLLGDQWDLAAQLLPYIALAVVLETLTNLPAVIAEAVGALREKLIIQIATLGLVVGFVWLAVQRGGRPHELALAWGVAQLIRHFAYLGLMNRLLRVDVLALCVIYAQAVCLSVATGVVSLTVVSLTSKSPAPLGLLLGGFAGASMYGLLFFLFASLKVRREIVQRDLLRTILRRGS